MDSNNPYGNSYYTDQRPGTTNQAPQYVVDARGHWHQSSASNHNQFGRPAAGFIASSHQTADPNTGVYGNNSPQPGSGRTAPH